MERTEFVKKEKDKADKRTSRIFLTTQGKKYVEELKHIWHNIENQLLKGFTEEEKAMTKIILQKLINNLSND